MRQQHGPFSFLENKADLSQNELHLDVDKVGMSVKTIPTRSEIDGNALLWRKLLSFWSLPMNELTLRVPCDPWEMFKQFYFPAWLLKHFPVRYVTEVYTVRMCFPESAAQCEEGLKRMLGQPIPLFRHEGTYDDKEKEE
jgi:hypothetical protein